MSLASQPTPPTPPTGTPYYRYDPNFGSPRDRYTRVDFTRSPSHKPEMPGRFVALVEGQTIMQAMWGRRTIKWRAEPGTPCLILGHWEDGTVHLKWPAIAHHYMVDGRFPAWVVREDPDALTAGGGFVLRANELRPGGRTLPVRLIGIVLLLVVLIVLLVWPEAREALQSLFRPGP
jgi:hypothetical protein